MGIHFPLHKVKYSTCDWYYLLKAKFNLFYLDLNYLHTC